MSKAIVEMLFSVLGGLGIFLLGMKNMSEGMQAVAGSKLRKLITAVTSNRLTACGIGVLITSLIQSSSVTTVMVVGLVNTSFMTLRQAIGVIMGANIGTTITGWILVLKIGKYGLPMLGIAAFIYLFTKNDKARYTAMAVMGIGMVFFGLELMSSGFVPLRSMPRFLEWFHKFSAVNYLGVLKCVAAGCLVTMIVQSSSATLGITMGMAAAGLVNFPTAAALVLGENIGTTITAFLASIGTTTNARRAAYAHMIFNALGVIWITALFFPYLRLVSLVVGVDPGVMVAVDGAETFPHIREGIAIVHSGFNIANTLVFLPFIPLLEKLVRRIAPDKLHKETPHLTFLNIRMLDTPAIGIQQSFVEVLRMGDVVTKMMTYLKECHTSTEPKEDIEKKIFHREEVLDIMQKEIVQFLSDLLSGNVAHDVMKSGRMHLRMADEYESVSDYVAEVLKLRLKLRNAALAFADEGEAEILDIHDHVQAYMNMINDAVSHDNQAILSKANTQGDAITHMCKESRSKHLARVENKQCSPLSSLIYTDILTDYRKIKDHMLNIAEALAGEK
jgi:phosphate:Na+ symporter